jgi:hypothetical protein
MPGAAGAVNAASAASLRNIPAKDDHSADAATAE